MLWLAMNPSRALFELPAGWAQGKFGETAKIHCGNSAKEVAQAVAAFFWEAPEGLVLWLQSQFAARIHPFERAVIEGELELLKEFSSRHRQTGNSPLQLALL
jgi:hypothetical protein